MDTARERQARAVVRAMQQHSEAANAVANLHRIGDELENSLNTAELNYRGDITINLQGYEPIIIRGYQVMRGLLEVMENEAERQLEFCSFRIEAALDGDDRNYWEGV